MDRLKREGVKKEYAEIVPEHPEINYHRLPIVSLVAMGNVMKELAAKLPAITVPTLIVQAKGDPVVTPDGSKRLFEKLVAKEKEYLLVDLNRHGILSGPGAEQVHSAIASFIERVLKLKETKV
jgi:carboxylesterase